MNSLPSEEWQYSRSRADSSVAVGNVAGHEYEPSWELLPSVHTLKFAPSPKCEWENLTDKNNRSTAMFILNIRWVLKVFPF